MNSRKIIGRKIVAVKQHREKTNGGWKAVLDYIELDNGVKLTPWTYEMPEGGEYRHTMFVSSPNGSDQPRPREKSL